MIFRESIAMNNSNAMFSQDIMNETGFSRHFLPFSATWGVCFSLSLSRADPSSMKSSPDEFCQMTPGATRFHQWRIRPLSPRVSYSLPLLRFDVSNRWTTFS